MELAFSTTDVRDVCEKHDAAVAAIGDSAALELEARLADIDAVETVAELAAIFSDQLLERTAHEKSLRLNSGYQLVFQAGHVKTPLTSEGATDWAKVSKIRVVAIESDP